MPLGNTSARRKAGGCGRRQAERFEDSLDEGVIEGPTIQHLDEPTEDDIATVAVGPALSGFVEKADLGNHLIDVALQTVVTLSSVGEVISTIDATRVAQEMTDRYSFGRSRNCDTKIGQMGPDGIVEPNLTTLHVWSTSSAVIVLVIEPISKSWRGSTPSLASSPSSPCFLRTTTVPGARKPPTASASTSLNDLIVENLRRLLVAFVL